MIGRRILSVLLIIFMALGIYVIVSSEMNEIKDQEIGQSVFDIYMADLEFSGIVNYDHKIIVGGNDGVFTIDPVTGFVEEVLNNDEPFTLVRSLAVKDGVLWIGHEYGVSLWTLDGVQGHYTLEDGLAGQRVNDIFVGTGGVYVGGFYGVSIIRDGEIQVLTEDTGLIEPVIKVIYQDKEGLVWMGSYMARSGGVTIMDPVNNTFSYLRVEDGLTHHAITTITETDQGVWVGGGSFTEGGATLFSKIENEWEPIETRNLDNGMIGGKIRFIFEDKKNQLWFSSETDGIAIMLDNDSFAYMTVEQGLSDNEVKEMTYDNYGNLWMATRRGVTKIDKEWLEINLKLKD